MNRAILLCGGQQNRFGGSLPKQLVDIHGEPLLARTIRQLRANGFEPLIAAHKLIFKQYSSILPCSMKTICHTLLKNPFPEGYERHTVLCGDVVWSDKKLNVVCHDCLPITFYGNFYSGEIFGFSFRWDMLDDVIRSTQTASQKGGRLWNLYHEIAGNGETEWYGISDGFTRDFDALSQYHDWINEHPAK